MADFRLQNRRIVFLSDSTLFLLLLSSNSVASTVNTVTKTQFDSPQRPSLFIAGLISLVALLCVSFSTVYAQRPLQVMAEAGQYISSGEQTPFWLRSNQYGIVPLKSPNSTLRVGASVNYDSLRLALRRISLGGGFQVVGNSALSYLDGQLIVPEAYVKARWRKIELYVGRRREIAGLLDSTLSSGSFAWSGNALPVPKIQLEIRDFLPVGFTKGWVAFKGSYAHGWLGGRYVQHTMLHSKSLYARLGKPEHRFHAYGGINHQVVWGGYSKELVGSGLVTSPYLPARPRDYFSLITGFRAVNSGVIDQSQYTDFDLTNRVGNHLGSVDFAFEYTGKTHSFYLYRQNPYETGALFYGVSLADGLNGLRIRSNNSRAIVRQVLIEFLNTTSQGGPEFVIDDPKRRGKVDYFNHSQFRDGWAYRAQTLGTPFINPAIGPNGEPPYGGYTNNNRVQVFHVGVAGAIPLDGLSLFDGPVTYETKISYSRNLGTYRVPYRTAKYQFSGIAIVAVPLSVLGGLQVTGSLALDQGDLYPSALGAYIGIRKDWSSIIRQSGNKGRVSRGFHGQSGYR